LLLWKILPDLYTQIEFYELIRIQNQVPEKVRLETYKILDSIFDFKLRAAKSSASVRSKGLNQDSISKLSIELARQKFIVPNEMYENAILAVYPKNADDLDLVFEKAYVEHHLVLFKVFKDKFLNFLSKNKTDDVMKKIDELISFDPEISHPESSFYKAFSDYVSKLNLAEDKDNHKMIINSKMLNMIYEMPESDLSKIENLKTNDNLRSKIPTFDWVDLEDMKMLKDFFSNLSGPQIKYFIEFDPKFNDAMNKLDERALFRFNERMKTEANMALDWRSFRDKIKKCYTYKSAGSDVQTNIAKAS
jgi:hypothetical protein